jgi:hypothetical protein
MAEQSKARTMKHDDKKHAALIANLRSTFPTHVLVAAMGAVLQARRERAGLDGPFRIPNPEEQLTQFLQSSSIRQLETMLPKLAAHLANRIQMTEVDDDDDPPDDTLDQATVGNTPRPQ